VTSEAEQYLGMSMTFSLFEFAKENVDAWLQEQPEQLIDARVTDAVSKLDIHEGQGSILQNSISFESIFG
jgi:hypothetical protein